MLKQVILFPRNVYPSYVARLGIKLFSYPLTLRVIAIGATNELDQIGHRDFILFADGLTMKNNKQNVCIRGHIAEMQKVPPENIHLLTSQEDLDNAFAMIQKMKEERSI